MNPRRVTMSIRINLPLEWVCDGKEIKLKTGAVMANTWLWDGKELKPKTGALMANT